MSSISFHVFADDESLMKILAKERKEMREIFQRETKRLEKEDRKLQEKNDQLQRQNDEQKKEMEKQSQEMKQLKAKQSQEMKQLKEKQSQEMKQLKAKLRQSLRQKVTVSVVSFEVDHRLTMTICTLCPSLLVLILFLLFPSNGTLNLRNISSAIMSLIFKS